MNIYIGNLSPEMTKDELCKEFTVFGEVTSVTIMNDKYIGSGQQRNYGYIEMASHSEAINAIANLEGKRLRNLSISVIRARPLSDKPETVPLNIRGNRRFNKTRERTDI
ncbi:RNA recognition motif domain-containing protein [Chloroflexota bacterium]